MYLSERTRSIQTVLLPPGLESRPPMSYSLVGCPPRGLALRLPGDAPVYRSFWREAHYLGRPVGWSLSRDWVDWSGMSHRNGQTARATTYLSSSLGQRSTLGSDYPALPINLPGSKVNNGVRLPCTTHQPPWVKGQHWGQTTLHYPSTSLGQRS